jgi:hypothetical protein
MSNKQSAAEKLIDDWQKQMQEYLNDPRIAELMIDYYAKFQSKMQDVAQKFSDQSDYDDDDGNGVTDELICRIKALETRVELLEKLLGRILKD